MAWRLRVKIRDQLLLRFGGDLGVLSAKAQALDQLLDDVEKLTANCNAYTHGNWVETRPENKSFAWALRLTTISRSRSKRRSDAGAAGGAARPGASRPIAAIGTHQGQSSGTNAGGLVQGCSTNASWNHCSRRFACSVTINWKPGTSS